MVELAAQKGAAFPVAKSPAIMLWLKFVKEMCPCIPFPSFTHGLAADIVAGQVTKTFLDAVPHHFGLHGGTWMRIKKAQ